jgi:TetR/AcrR family transcriptional regulator, cholesterol catabolism regulator
MNVTGATRTQAISTQIKNTDLVERRRQQIIDAVVPLFIEQGFHKTTTRQIARAAGFSIGTLYEYVACKEDVLFLVCQDIHDRVAGGIAGVLSGRRKGQDALAAVIREYFGVCHRMNDVILLMYQEIHALPAQWKKKVLENELKITGIIREAIEGIFSSGGLPNLKASRIDLIAHDIVVLGHMWAFRRWTLSGRYSIEDYTEQQIRLITDSCCG